MIAEVGWNFFWWAVKESGTTLVGQYRQGDVSSSFLLCPAEVRWAEGREDVERLQREQWKMVGKSEASLANESLSLSSIALAAALCCSSCSWDNSADDDATARLQGRQKLHESPNKWRTLGEEAIITSSSSFSLPRSLAGFFCMASRWDSLVTCFNQARRFPMGVRQTLCMASVNF